MAKTTKGTRVPRALPSFDKYIRTVVALLFTKNPATTNLWWVDLLLSNAEANQAQGFLTKWYTGVATNPGVWELHTNPDTKTKNTRKNVVKLIKDFAAFFNPLLIRMSGSALVTTNARTTMHIAEPNPKKTIHKESIKEQCFAKHIDLGGGKHEFLCATSHDNKKPSVADTANGVLVSYSIVDVVSLKAQAEFAARMAKDASAANAPNLKPLQDSANAASDAVPVPPASPEDCNKQKVFSGSKVLLDLGAGNKGKTLYLFLQWNDSKHPERVGPAGDIITVSI